MSLSQLADASLNAMRAFPVHGTEVEEHFAKRIKISEKLGRDGRSSLGELDMDSRQRYKRRWAWAQADRATVADSRAWNRFG